MFWRLLIYHMSELGQTPQLNPQERGGLKQIHTINLKDRGYVRLEKTSPGTFKIVGDSVTMQGGDPNVDATGLGFRRLDDKDDSVRDLDDES